LTDLYAQKTVICGDGGLGCSAAMVAKTVNSIRRNGSPGWEEYFGLDFSGAADPVPPGLIARYGLGQIRALSHGETIELDLEPAQEWARSENDDKRWAPLEELCPRDVLAKIRSQQAGQKPAAGRAALWCVLDNIAPQVEQALRNLSDNGRVVTELRRTGFLDSQISKSLRVVLVAGAEGGTGSGTFLLTALLFSSIAKQLGISIEMEAWLAFRYRPTQAREAEFRVALGEQLTEDVEAAQSPGTQLAVVTYSGRPLTTSTPLFHRVFCFEGHGRVLGDAAELSVMMGEAIAYRTTSMAAHVLDTAYSQNILNRSRFGEDL
jgi:hypothetical protein